MDKKITGYELSRNFFDWCFENSEKINPNHTALYFFILEHCNRLGWKTVFGLPSGVAMEAIGIRSHNTYIKTLNDLISFGFVKMVEKSKNQYTANIVALSKINKAHDKALDEALIKHYTKQSESTIQSIDSIIKQITKNKEPIKPLEAGASTSDFFNACKDVWFKYNEGWQFEGKDGAAIKSLAGKIQKAQEDAGEPITPESTAAAFEYILQSIRADNFYSTANPSTLNSHFNTIFKKLKNSKNGTTNNKRATDYTNSIFA